MIKDPRLHPLLPRLLGRCSLLGSFLSPLVKSAAIAADHFKPSRSRFGHLQTSSGPLSAAAAGTSAAL